MPDDTPPNRTLEERLDQVYQSRKLFSLWLLPPLAFFVVLVAWFREGFILIAVGCAIYAYMLAQFFIFQNPARRARKAADARDGTESDAHATRGNDVPA
jgi:hypothetical protein